MTSTSNTPILTAQQRTHLDRHGWVVVPQVVKAELCDRVFRDTLDYAADLLEQPHGYFDCVVEAVDDQVPLTKKLYDEICGFIPRDAPFPTKELQEENPLARRLANRLTEEKKRQHEIQHQCGQDIWDVWELKTIYERSREFVEKLSPLHGYMLRGHGFGYLQSVVECKAATAKIYRELYGTDKFLFSQDNPSIGPPPEYSNLFTQKGPFPLHLDDIHGVGTIQSWIALRGVNSPHDATLCVLDGSSKHFADFQKHKAFFSGNNHNNWSAGGHKLTPEDLVWYRARNCIPICIPCKKGDMVIWKSETAHCGTRPNIKERPLPDWRAVLYTHAFLWGNSDPASGLSFRSHLTHKRWTLYKRELINGNGTNHIADGKLPRQRPYGSTEHLVITPVDQRKKMAAQVDYKPGFARYFGQDPAVRERLNQLYGKKHPGLNTVSEAMKILPHYHPAPAKKRKSTARKRKPRNTTPKNQKSQQKKLKTVKVQVIDLC